MKSNPPLSFINIGQRGRNNYINIQLQLVEYLYYISSNHLLSILYQYDIIQNSHKEVQMLHMIT